MGVSDSSNQGACHGPNKPPPTASWISPPPARTAAQRSPRRLAARISSERAGSAAAHSAAAPGHPPTRSASAAHARGAPRARLPLSSSLASLAKQGAAVLRNRRAGRTDKRISVASPSSSLVATSLAERGGRALPSAAQGSKQKIGFARGVLLDGVHPPGPPQRARSRSPAPAAGTDPAAAADRLLRKGGGPRGVKRDLLFKKKNPGQKRPPGGGKPPFTPVPGFSLIFFFFFYVGPAPPQKI